LLVAGSARALYAWGVPLNGDEAGVGLLQAAGQAASYAERMPKGVAPLDDWRAFTRPQPALGPAAVFDSLRTAGLHPPLYYLVLHYVMRLSAFDRPLLRAFSILCSTASVLALYSVGAALFSPQTGLLAALLLAVSPYGVVYGVMVRPYPLAMLLALVATLLAVRLTRDRAWSLRGLDTWLYALVVSLGVYTIYQFAFVAACHAFLACLYDRRARTAAAVLGVAALVALSLLPWLPTLVAQLEDIRAHPTYYFHRPVSAAGLVRLVAHAFAPPAPLAIPPLVSRAAGAFAGLCLFGGWLGALGRRRPATLAASFAAAFALHLALYWVVERAFSMTTLVSAKFQFFVLPVLLLFAAAGLASLERAAVRIGAAATLVVLVCAHTLTVLATRPHLSPAEGYLAAVSAAIDQAPATRTLVLVNTGERRCVLPLARAISASADLAVIGTSRGALRGLAGAFTPYRRIFVVDLDVDYDPASRLEARDLQGLDTAAAEAGLLRRTTLVSGDGTAVRHTLTVYDRERGKP
jgi:4-amino-4-deoxy-L-arabinose transferase-like glycosyltransferase